MTAVAQGAGPLHVLIRHADAGAHASDALRTLSARGRDQVDRLSGRLAGEPRFQPAEIWHSPLVRARQTAVALAAGLAFRGALRERPGLEPEDDPGAAATWLAAEARPIAVVGHEPHLAALVALLVSGEAPTGRFGFAKAGALALWREAAGWRSEWLVESP